MGRAVEQLATTRSHQIVSDLHAAEAAIDFSHPSQVKQHVQSACDANLPLVIGTTGWEKELGEVEEIVQSCGGAALYAPNLSIGVLLFEKLLSYARALYSDYDVAGVEFHHKDKIDAPSGTAKKLSSSCKLPPFSSVRVGHYPGRHEIHFDSSVDTVVLSHCAKNREGFALGALRAAEWIVNQKGWLTTDDMLRSLYSPDHSL